MRESSAVVLHAPPGAGKTTRVPLALLAELGAAAGRIIMLEPRRLAAVHAAARMAQALGEAVGETVGYAIRFDRRVSARTRIEVVTEGILTRRLQHDPCLEGVSLVIFDEFHERNLNADLALALCREVQREVRPDLKLLVMSATLDCAPVAALLGGAPVLVAAGRSFPVTVHYLEESGQGRLPLRMAAAVRRALGETDGDLLAFLPGSGEIRACQEILQQELAPAAVDLLPLYGELPFADQERAIQPGDRRKVVLATNIAETSLTIEGVRVVLDSGLSRLLRYDAASGMDKLVTVRESRASAVQRAGRAGRLAPGVCYRLFSSHTFTAMTGFSPAEITVADLAPLVLELAVWGVRDVTDLSWLDAPPEAALVAARGLLHQLAALDGNGCATLLGKRMAELPVHPRLARMLLSGRELGLALQACVLAALLSERDVFQYRPDEQASICTSDLLERYEAVAGRRRGDGRLRPGAARTVERIAGQFARHMQLNAGKLFDRTLSEEDAGRLLLAAYPDRVALQRSGGSDRYLLANGRGAVLTRKSGVRNCSLLLAVQVDAGEQGDGRIHQACSLAPELVREVCGAQLVRQRRVVWDDSGERVLAWDEERLGAVALSRKPAVPGDDEAVPLLVAVVVGSALQVLNWSRAVQCWLGRVRLLRQAFPEEDWPDLESSRLAATCAQWLGPFLAGLRSRRDLAGLDLLRPLQAMLSREQLRIMEVRTPLQLTVPSGNRIAIDYAAEAEPVLAVKLQELFGLADTPTIAGGRVTLLLHLLSPAGRPVQVTRDLRGFWESAYREVRRELRGRYPKHPWPDDPWQATPTRKTTRMLKGGT
jgi:ATP-dependent helicase HrpB